MRTNDSDSEVAPTTSAGPYPDTLSGAATLSARTFDTLEEALDAVLRLLQELLGMRAVFLTRVDHQRGLLTVVAARNAPGSFVVPVGLELPLEFTP